MSLMLHLLWSDNRVADYRQDPHGDIETYTSGNQRSTPDTDDECAGIVESIQEKHRVGSKSKRRLRMEDVRILPQKCLRI